jgi:hypothetical protein
MMLTNVFIDPDAKNNRVQAFFWGEGEYPPSRRRAGLYYEDGREGTNSRGGRSGFIN